MSVLSEKAVIENVLLEIERLTDKGLDYIEEHKSDTEKMDLSRTVGYLTGILRTIDATLDVLRE